MLDSGEVIVSGIKIGSLRLHKGERIVVKFRFLIDCGRQYNVAIVASTLQLQRPSIGNKKLNDLSAVEKQQNEYISQQ